MKNQGFFPRLPILVILGVLLLGIILSGWRITASKNLDKPTHQ